MAKAANGVKLHSTFPARWARHEEPDMGWYGGRRNRLTGVLGALATAVAVTVTMAAAPARALPGDGDPAFGISGQVTTDLGGTYDWAYATAVQPDGRILAAGVSNAHGTYDFAVTRYTAAGQLDPSFGDHGVVTTDFGGSYDWAYALALQPDGRIVLGGVSDRSGSRDFALARYNADGSLDGSFGRGGLLVTPVRPLTTDSVHGLALQPDGKIVAAGVTYDDTVSLRPHGDFMTVRYTPEGSLDPGFGVGGIVTTGFDRESYDEPYAVVLQPDGRIVLGGVSNTGGGIGRIFGADDLALVRYLPNGLLDPGFGQGGKVLVDAGSIQESIRALALDRQGRIVAAGRTSGEKRGDFVLARFVSDGSLDRKFGASRRGLTITDLGTAEEGLSAVSVAPDGTIVAGGIVAPEPHGDLAVVRYDTTGTFDRSFGRDGVARADTGGRDDRLRGLALQPDGAAVVVGSSETDFVVARFTTAAPR
jgi:uncharacterized delta-60 repeat protein